MIKLTLQCIAGDNEIPDALLDEIDAETEWRDAYINIDQIYGIYPSSESGTLIEFGNNLSWLVKQDLETVNKLIDEERTLRFKDFQ